MKPASVCGVGINDAQYPLDLRITVEGKAKRLWICPFYKRWVSMLVRCYSEKFVARCPTYKGCSVCDEWLTFSNFKAWMETQDWKDKQLDKDILVPGNKVYSPETCVFISGALNKFTTDSNAKRGQYPVGVHVAKTGTHKGKFVAQCKNPFTGQRGFIGRYETEQEALSAWRKRKYELACQYADMQTDSRLAQALRDRYAL